MTNTNTNNPIRVRYSFKEYPNTTLSVFFKTREQVDAFKKKHPYYVYEDSLS